MFIFFRLTNGGVHHSVTTPIISTDLDADDDEVDEVPDPVTTHHPTNQSPSLSHMATQKAELVEEMESTIEMSGDYYPPPPPPLPLHEESLSPSLEFLTPRKDRY